jgi:hypothetical protein
MSAIHLRFVRKFVLVTVTLFVCYTAFSWGITGHRVIGEIAQQHLSKKAKKELSKIIGKESLAWWANWPDFIKSDSTWDHASKWHYVNLPAHLSKDAFIDGLKKQPGENLYTQIKAMMTQLADESLPKEQRQIAFRFLVHFVGDLHQPLHVGRAEDQGGNRITVYWFDKKTNLHSLWDSGIVDFQGYSYSEYARLLNIADKAQVQQWQTTSLEEWFYESNQLADTIYASAAPEAKLGYRYNFLFQKTLDEQLLKGGVRLAALLNETFK